ncbi:class I SAM-dependent methyltransferase [Hydrocarboniphaga sp.]|uniref:class I SAM-dependent methyltransferase n=1 Tax=Hydrocarboniphaga sp. TaxID=2033016 RepID=UPI00261FF9CE|nr:class I SAM-dependent methyltransferase [Hydrocarboniphaga sp.]
MSLPEQIPLVDRSDILDQKRRKLDLIASIVRSDMPHRRTQRNYDFLSAELQRQFKIVATDGVSAHDYDPFALRLIEAASEGWVLDCGAGKRGRYYDHVVNFEIVDYDTTDVLGVGEVLPFKDGVFDGVLSLNVLEHVKDPFKCASEIARVLKPGGKLYCVVPFLQPLHAFPHHYYNMTAQGLRNLFEPGLHIERQEMLASGLPIWALCSLVSGWASGLSGVEKEEFLQMKLARFLENPIDLLKEPFVKQLSREKNFELACTTALFARKP